MDEQAPDNKAEKRRKTWRGLCGVVIGLSIFHLWEGKAPRGSLVWWYDMVFLFAGTIGMAILLMPPKKQPPAPSDKT